VLTRDGNTALQAPKQGTRKLNPWDRRKLSRILKGRYGNHNVPAGDRDWVLALLLCGFKAEQVLADAPWLEPDELPALGREARKLSFEDIGRLIRLTDEERTHYKAGQFFPIDVSREEIAKRKRAKRNKAQRERRARQQPTVRKADARMAAIRRMLKDEPRSMAELVRRARLSRAFGPVVFAKILVDANRKRAEVVRELVRRTVKQLVAFGAVALTMRKGVRGPVVLVRQISCEGFKKCSAPSGTRFVPVSPRQKRRGGNGLNPVSLHRTPEPFAYSRGHDIRRERLRHEKKALNQVVKVFDAEEAWRWPMGGNGVGGVTFEASEAVWIPWSRDNPMSSEWRH
jgi:hypothetical protein